MQAALDGTFDGILSAHVIGELYRILTIRWIRKNGDGAESERELSRLSKDMMDVLLAAFTLVDTGPQEGEVAIALPDGDDYHLVRAARLASATHVVSENVRDFPPADGDGRHRYEGIEFLTAAQFFTALTVPKP